MFAGPESQPSALLDAKTLLDGIIGALAGGVLGVAGGVLGAVISLQAERRNRRTEVAVNILERYMAEFQEIGEVKGLLGHPEVLVEKTQWLNRVIRIGDWYDVIAGLCLNKIAESSFLEKMGFKDEMKAFLELVRSASPQVPLLDNAAKHWNHLDSYIK